MTAPPPSAPVEKELSTEACWHPICVLQISCKCHAILAWTSHMQSTGMYYNYL